MTQSNVSNSTNGAQHSAFQSVQSALARKPLPGPRWAWPSLAALAVAAVAYLVAGTTGEHAGHRAAPPPSAESATSEASNPVTTTAAALRPAAPEAAPTNPPPSPAPAPVGDLAASAPKAGVEPLKASDAAAKASDDSAKASDAAAKANDDSAKASDDSAQAVATTSATTKKKARRGHRGSRKRSPATH